MNLFCTSVRRDLYVELEKASLYKPKYKFEEITMEEAQVAIDFLMILSYESLRVLGRLISFLLALKS